MFTSAIWHYIQRLEQVDAESVEGIQQDYCDVWESIPGAPPPDQLTEDDVPGVVDLDRYPVDTMDPWPVFCQGAAARRNAALDALNPYLPNWFSKTEDRPSVWVSDNLGLSDPEKTLLTARIKLSSPLRGRLPDMLATGPTSDALALSEITQAIINVAPSFVWDLGEGDDPVWRWGPSLCLLAGLGSTVLREVARAQIDEPDWGYWATCSDDDLAKDVADAHLKCGYPIGGLRLEWRHFRSMADVMVVTTSDGHATLPRWMRALAVLHILKHTRLITNWSGDGKKHAFQIMHRGTASVIGFSADLLSLPMSSAAMAPVIRDVCSALSMPYVSNPAKREWKDDLTSAALSVVRPCDLVRVRQPDAKPEIIISPAVVISAIKERHSEYRWIDTGVAVRNVATIDPSSGVVNKDSVLTGPDTVAYRWPIADFSRLDQWRASLPDIVRPELPSAILRRAIKNINDLGHPEGLWALIDAAMVTDVLRSQLRGTTLGNVLNNEFPIIAALPKDGTLDKSTEQGKTNVMRILGWAVAPGCPVTPMSRSPSAPTQRVLAAPFETHGTALLDEFMLPASPEHFLNQAQIQSLCTGGTGGPGRAVENSPGFRLRHPLFIAAKVAAFPPDIINRMIPIIMDPLSDETRSTEEALAEVLSGKIANTVRLSMLFWLQQSGLTDILSTIKLQGKHWRFNGHLTVASVFADVERISEYLAAARVQCDAQRDEADASGLADDIGVNNRFDPLYYWTEATEFTREHLASSCIAGPDAVIALTAGEVLRHLVEDGGRRKLDSILSSYRLKEKAAAAQLLRAVETRPIPAGGYEMVTADSHDRWGHRRPGIIVRKVNTNGEA